MKRISADFCYEMVIGSPGDRYDPSVASDILHRLGDRVVEAATERLLAENVFSKVIRDPSRKAPGRTIKISDP